MSDILIGIYINLVLIFMILRTVQTKGTILKMYNKQLNGGGAIILKNLNKYYIIIIFTIITIILIFFSYMSYKKYYEYKKKYEKLLIKF